MQHSQIFDMFNSSNIFESKPHQKPFRGSEFQLQFLDDSKAFIQNIAVKTKGTGRDVSRSIKCLNGWIISINSLHYLWNKLSQEGFKYIFTRRLNQDCVENFFCYVRKQGGNCTSPTPVQFCRASKKHQAADPVKGIKHVNCEEQDHLVLPIVQHELPDGYTVPENVEPLKIALPTDFKDMNLGEQNVFVYFCGYLMKK